MLLYTHEIGLS